MVAGWWIAIFLLVLVVIQGVAYKRLKDQLRRQTAESARLSNKLSSTTRELFELNTRRKKLLSASTQALIIVEGDFRISSANKVAKRLFGKSAKGSTLMSWTRQYQLQELVEQTLQGQKVSPVYLHFHGRTLEVHARSIKAADQVVAVALAIHDVTELQHLSRARRDFVTNISHELRNPIASLKLLTETLLNGGLDDKEFALELISKMTTQVETLSQLAHEVLDLSLIESGRMPLKMSSHALKEIAQTQTERLLPQIEHKNLSLTLDISDDITVLADETMVGRVITNLVHNAIKFTSQGGITLSAYKTDGNTLAKDKQAEGEWITVQVSDTGLGIAPDELPRIFERFYKVDQARSRQSSGTGLGLAIAKHIVEAHGGHIWAKSNGRGSHFYFTLPTEEDVPEPTPETLTPEP
jgi:two-component system, OmpR family, phosphate regulon sensor histidine kinase PhoR